MSTLGPTRQTRTADTVERHGVSFAVAADPKSYSTLLTTMRRRSLLTTRMLAGKLGVAPATVNQYFYRKRGTGGTSTLKWFLRFAEACGCKVYITFPTGKMPGATDVVVPPGALIGVGETDD